MAGRRTADRALAAHVVPIATPRRQVRREQTRPTPARAVPTQPVERRRRATVVESSAAAISPVRWAFIGSALLVVAAATSGQA